MLAITPSLSIDESEIQLDYIRASGPGGQNVNKVATAVQLRFDLLHSPSLEPDVKERLSKLAGSRLTAESVLVIEAKRFRTQEQNRIDALPAELALHCGLREDEIAGLKGQNVDTGHKLLHRTGKGGRYRPVPIPEDLLRQLNRSK